MLDTGKRSGAPSSYEWRNWVICCESASTCPEKNEYHTLRLNVAFLVCRIAKQFRAVIACIETRPREGTRVSTQERL
jgi:hypothetical protein